MTINGVSEETLRLLQSLGIIITALIGSGSLLIAAWSARQAAEVASVGNLFTITAAHRDIWRQYATRPELQGALDWDADADDISADEQRFLQEVVLHLNASWLAGQAGILPEQEGLDADVRQLLLRPKPRSVWNELRRYQNRDFRDWVDKLLEDGEQRHQGRAFGRPHSRSRTEPPPPLSPGSDSAR